MIRTMPAAAHPPESTPMRPPWALNVIREPDPDEVNASIDWSGWYLTDEEDVGEGLDQGRIIWLFRQVLEELARERHWRDVYVASDHFYAWLPEEPLVRVSPDVYVKDGLPGDPPPRMWETWRPGHHPPRFALEVVSAHPSRPSNWRKDYCPHLFVLDVLGARLRQKACGPHESGAVSPPSRRQDGETRA